jgi:hypothetical protein
VPTQDDDPDPPEATSGEGSSFRQALVDERQKRRDWKDRAARAEAATEELRKQLEEAKKPPVPAPQPRPQPGFQFTDWATNPEQAAQERFENQLFHISEMMTRARIGDEAADKLLSDFQTLAERDPTLWYRVRGQRDPWAWAEAEVKRQHLLADMGTDPAAYRARIEAELRAKWEAERAAAQPAAPANPPPPNMPVSLATVRSVAGRTAPAWTGPPSDADTIAQNRAERMAGRLASR